MALFLPGQARSPEVRAEAWQSRWLPWKTVAYAAVDEIHQLFVAGRSGRFLDVCIDGIGAFGGVLGFLVCYKALVRFGVFSKENKKYQ